ncbi:MAG: 50S ribosomal protein bL37 [Acidimicrobiales bacterium]
MSCPSSAIRQVLCAPSASTLLARMRPTVTRLARCRARAVTSPSMSKRTTKRKIRSKKNANHGKRPNAGRG